MGFSDIRDSHAHINKKGDILLVDMAWIGIHTEVYSYMSSRNPSTNLGISLRNYRQGDRRTCYRYAFT